MTTQANSNVTASGIRSYDEKLKKYAKDVENKQNRASVTSLRVVFMAIFLAALVWIYWIYGASVEAQTYQASRTAQAQKPKVSNKTVNTNQDQV